jgi:hypothetical protein
LSRSDSGWLTKVAKVYGYGASIWRDSSGLVGLALQTFSQGHSVNGNQIASTRPVSSR